MTAANPPAGAKPRKRRRVQWPLNAIVLLISAIPAFTGYPLSLDGMHPAMEVVTGIGWRRVIYFLIVHILVHLLLGARIHARIVAAAALITLPVVYAGALISWAVFGLGWSAQSSEVFGPHYVRLALTMLTVVPLALGLVATIPFGRFEHRLLLRPEGVTSFEKKALMALRVFHHIAFHVLPATLEILREERPVRGERAKDRVGGPVPRTALGTAVHLGVAIICSALQYIPLWAAEIAQLPERGARKDDCRQDGTAP